MANGAVALAVFQMGNSKPAALPTPAGRPMFGGVASYAVDDQGLLQMKPGSTDAGCLTATPLSAKQSFA